MNLATYQVTSEFGKTMTFRAVDRDSAINYFMNRIREDLTVTLVDDSKVEI